MNPENNNNGLLDKLLIEKFTNIFRKGYVTFNEITMPIRYGDFKEEIDNFEVHDDDIWICSFPKTGTTWTQEMIWLLANNLNYKGAEKSLGERFPFLEVSSVFDYRDLIKENHDFNPPPFMADSLGYIKKMQRPRFIKTHLPWDLLPKQIRDGSKKVKIIYIARNPKDTCISYYHHCLLLEGYTGNFEEFCNLFLAGKLSFAPFWSNVLNFWERRHESNVLFLKYEDLKNDLITVIKRASEFLNVKITNDEIGKLKRHLSFDSMKSNRAVNYEFLVDFNKKFNLIKEEGSFMRSGTVGNYKAIMSIDTIKKFDSWAEKNLKNTDLEL